jgi:diguanylate cyclase (GGDEF)-like protein/PAS domain S-box-containing protein
MNSSSMPPPSSAALRPAAFNGALLWLAAALCAASAGWLVWAGLMPAPNLRLLPFTGLASSTVLLSALLVSMAGLRFAWWSVALMSAGFWGLQIALVVHPDMSPLRMAELGAYAGLLSLPFALLAWLLLIGERQYSVAAAGLLLLAGLGSAATFQYWWPLQPGSPVTGLLAVNGLAHLGVALWLRRLAPRPVELPVQPAFAAAHISEGEANELRFAHVFNRAAVGVVMTAADGRWLWANPRLAEIVGRDMDTLRRLGLNAITHEDDLAVAEAMQRQLLAGEIDDYAIEQRYRDAQGAVVWVNLFVRRLDASDLAPLRVIWVVEDISKRRANEARLQTLTTHLERQVSERTAQLHLTMNNWKQRNLELTLLARMSAALQGAENLAVASTLISKHLPEIFADYGGAVYLRMEAGAPLQHQFEWGGFHAAQLQLQPDDCWGLQLRCEHRVDDPADPLPCAHLIANRDEGLCHADGGLETHSCMPIIADGTVLGMLYLQWSERSDSQVVPPDKVLIATTTEQIGMAIRNLDLREQLQRQVIRDPLTSLYNRRFLDDYLQRRIAESMRSGKGVSVLLFDLDHFKLVNDRFGHDAGDHVLCAFAEMLQSRVRADEAAFRLGGEEFVLVVNSDRVDEVQGCGERVRQGTEALKLQFAGRHLPPITISGGAASYPSHGDSIAGLIRAADQALYRAKQQGRNRICLSEHMSPVGMMLSAAPVAANSALGPDPQALTTI